jgi:hypothetical protein
VKLFFTKPHASAHSRQIFAKTIANFFSQKSVNFPVITKMVTSFHILLTNFPFCNNPEENLKFVNFASNFCENAKTKIFVSTLQFLSWYCASWSLSSISRKPLVARSLKVSTELVISNFTESLIQ